MIVIDTSRDWESPAANCGTTGRFMTIRQEVMNAIFMLQCACRNAGLPVDTEEHVVHYEFLRFPHVLFYKEHRKTGVHFDFIKADYRDLITGAGQLEYVHGVRETSRTMG